MSLHLFAGDTDELPPSLSRAAIEPGAHVFMWREVDADSDSLPAFVVAFALRVEP